MRRQGASGNHMMQHVFQEARLEEESITFHRLRHLPDPQSGGRARRPGVDGAFRAGNHGQVPALRYADKAGSGGEAERVIGRREGWR